MSDIVLCTPATYFQDAAHVPLGLVSGDGVQVFWPLLLGPRGHGTFSDMADRMRAFRAIL
jgi:enoyl-CoA hydratase/carnithine racemase